MAQFNADILFNADVRKALQGVNKLEGGVRSLVIEIEKFENTFKRIAAGPSNKVALAQQRQITGAINEQNRALAAQVATATQLGARYDAAARSAAAFARSIQEAQQASQKLLSGGFVGQRALPGAGGSSQKLLPAAGQTGRGGFQQAAQRAAEIDAQNYSASVNKSIQAANELTETIYGEIEARRRVTRAVENVTAASTQAQRLLPGTAETPRAAQSVGGGTR